MRPAGLNVAAAPASLAQTHSKVSRAKNCYVRSGGKAVSTISRDCLYHLTHNWSQDCSCTCQPVILPAWHIPTPERPRMGSSGGDSSVITYPYYQQGPLIACNREPAGLGTAAASLAPPPRPPSPVPHGQSLLTPPGLAVVVKSPHQP